MVADIKTCSQEIVYGLKNRIDSLEKQQEPLEILVNLLKSTHNLKTSFFKNFNLLSRLKSCEAP